MFVALGQRDTHMFIMMYFSTMRSYRCRHIHLHTHIYSCLHWVTFAVAIPSRRLVSNFLSVILIPAKARFADRTNQPSQISSLDHYGFLRPLDRSNSSLSCHSQETTVVVMYLPCSTSGVHDIPQHHATPRYPSSCTNSNPLPVVECFNKHLNPSSSAIQISITSGKLQSLSIVPSWLDYLLETLQKPSEPRRRSTRSSWQILQARASSARDRSKPRQRTRQEHNPATSNGNTSPLHHSQYEYTIMPRKSGTARKPAASRAKQTPSRKGVEQKNQSPQQSTSSPDQNEAAETPSILSNNTLQGLDITTAETHQIEATMSPSTPGHSRNSSQSSNLSSAPSDLGKTPVGLISPEKRIESSVVGDGSPVRRSTRKRKAPERMNAVENVKATNASNKRRKISDSSTTSGSIDAQDQTMIDQEEAANRTVNQDTGSSPRTSENSNRSHTAPNGTDTNAPINGENMPIVNQAVKQTSPTAEEKRIIKQFQTKIASLLHANAVHPRWPEFKANEVVVYGADATTISTPDQLFDSPSPSPAKRAARGNGRGGGRGGSNGGRGRGTGRGGRGGAVPPGKSREESQEPPPPKQVTTEEDQNVMRLIRKRQAELRQFFTNVGGQQREILDQLATRDLNKLVKKAKAHKQVPEYDEVVEELDYRKADIEELIRREYEIKKAQAIKEMEMEKELIEENYRRHVEQVKEEHVRGAAGDVALFKNAHAAKADDTYTQGGSEVDYFPYYHEIPEADAHVRGYLSNKIIDEQPFRVSLPSFDELAKRDVIEDEVTGPVIKSIHKEHLERQAEIDRENSAHRAEEIRKKTQTMTALTAEAEKQLEEMKGYLIPRPFREPQEQQYALSRLADMADYMRRAHPNQYYIFMPLPPDVKFPKEALSFKRHPEEGGHLFPQPMPAPLPTPTSRAPPPPILDTSMRSTQLPANYPPDSTQSAPEPSIRTPTQFGPPGPHRQIAMKPIPPPPTYPLSDQSRRSSLRNLAPQPIPPPPFPPVQHHQQQYTFVTPQQPPQSAQFVPSSTPHNIQNLHHHRHNSSTTASLPPTPLNLNINNITPVNGSINGLNNNNSNSNPNPTHPVTNSNINNRIRARSKSGSVTTTTTTATVPAPAPPLSLASQQNKIPMQFVNSTPESARMKALQQAQAAAANAAAASAAQGGSGSGGSGGGSNAGGNGGGNGKGRTLLPKP